MYKRQVLVGFYTLGGLVSEFDILDSAKINERGLMLRACDGRLICHKLSVQNQGRVTKEHWKQHFTALLAALEGGIRKVGKYLNYVLFGWRKEDDGMAVNEYVTKEKGNTTQVAELKAGGLKAFMAELERVGLDGIPARDMSVNNKLQEFFEMWKVYVNGNKGRFMQMAVAREYWSPCHTDDDMFYMLHQLAIVKPWQPKKARMRSCSTFYSHRFERLFQ